MTDKVAERLTKLKNFMVFLDDLNNNIIFPRPIFFNKNITTVMIPLDLHKRRVLKVTIDDDCTISLGNWKDTSPGNSEFAISMYKSFGSYGVKSSVAMLSTIRDQITVRDTITRAMNEGAKSIEALRNLKDFLDYAEDKIPEDRITEIDPVTQTITYTDTIKYCVLNVSFIDDTVGIEQVGDDYYDRSVYTEDIRADLLEYVYARMHHVN